MGSDYSLQQPGEQSYSIIFFPGEMSDECRPVLILEDSRLEGNESFTMNLETTSSVADLDPTISTVTIIDNDGEYFTCFLIAAALFSSILTEVRVGFAEASYNIREDQQSLPVCVDLTGQTEIPLVISVVFNEGQKYVRFFLQ